jgi:hypothetical protein
MTIDLEENDIYLLDYEFHEKEGDELRPLVLTHVRVVND